LISLFYSAKGLVKVFRRVISKVRVSRLLVVLCKVVQRLEKESRILRAVISQKNHRKITGKRELVVPFSF